MNAVICPIFYQTQIKPDACFLLGSHGSLSYQETDYRIALLCDRLEHMTVKRGERVAILAKNSFNYILLLFALKRLGAVAVVLNLRLSETDWKMQIELSASKLLIVEDEITIEQLSCRCIRLSELVENLAGGQLASSRSHLSLYPKDEATIMFTSGSKGATKGARLSLSNHYLSATSSNKCTKLSHYDCWLLSLPLYHTGGLEILYRTAFAGASVYVPDSFGVETITALVESGKISHLSLIPNMLENLLKVVNMENFFSKVKALLLSGAPYSEHLRSAVNRYKLPTIFAYGLTETTGHCVCTDIGEHLPHVGYVGRAFSGVEFKIVDEQGGSCAAGQLGEIAIRGGVVFEGYLGDSEHKRQDWFFTGDMGSYDALGKLTVCGRKDDMFISGGENIFPQEIENAAAKLRGVCRCAVIAVDDDDWGRRPVLFVSPDKNLQLDVNEVKQQLSQLLPKFKQPDRIIIVENMPLTSIGKTDYETLKTLVRS